MKKLLPALTFLLVVSITSCRNEGDGAPKALPGHWRNVSFRMIMPTYHKGQSTFRLEADEQNYAQVMDMNPYHYFFQPDGTYRQEYRDTSEYPFAIHGGAWQVDDGKLTIYQKMPFADTTVYTLRIKGDTIFWETMRDFDSDGEADDFSSTALVKVPE